jgi:ATP-dependent HslUV protease ATP-binding subunit HslU
MSDETAGDTDVPFDEMTPRQIVAELDKHIIGQARAKRALALAIRDRLRRQKLPLDIAHEVDPRNIILIGPTGVGKTELARRLARLSHSPFIKVEASKFSEVGYVGRDAESMIRDLVDVSVEMVRDEQVDRIEQAAEEKALERLAALLSPARSQRKSKKAAASPQVSVRTAEPKNSYRLDELRRDLSEGKLKDRVVELEVQERFVSPAEFIPVSPEDDSEGQLRELLAGMLGVRTFKRTMNVEDAIGYLITEEESKLVDMDRVTREAVDRVESSGIVFLDELDKIASRETGHGPDVSREGVQRDILPVVEGTTVHTRFGSVQTDHVLFIAAGAFHVSKPSDLIPELQGRFPVRVEMDSLSEKDFVAILNEPESSLVKQYQALLKVDGVELKFTRGALEQIAHFAALVNQTGENIGARRLVTMMEALLEDISFAGPELRDYRVLIDRRRVKKKLAAIAENADLSRYIL